jgi:protein AbiQ
MSFAFYRADTDYCNFLRESDPCVPYTIDKKTTRPFVGIVFSINGYNYYAPLTSPKPKHLTMKNQIDFLKINGGAWGAINFNNMIPIHTKSLLPIGIKILPTDDKAAVDYKNLLANQLSWCNTTENIALITGKAQKLYATITGKTARPELVERCCNFVVDEAQYRIYCITHNLSTVKTH